MSSLFQAIGLENKKMRGRGVWMIWALLTLAMLGWLTYDVLRKGQSTTTVTLFESVFTQYYAEQTGMAMLFGLFMPIMAAILISRLTEVEHTGDTWKMLRGAGEKTGTLWDAKFVIVYFMMELSLFLIYAIVFSLQWMKIGGSFPLSTLAMNFLGVSMVNFIVLVLFATASFFFQNQIICLSLGLLGGLAGLLSGLLPKMVVYFIPTGYYMFCSLCEMSGGEFNEFGQRVWHYSNADPNYGFIAIAFAVALVLYFVIRKKLNEKEF